MGFCHITKIGPIIMIPNEGVGTSWYRDFLIIRQYQKRYINSLPISEINNVHLQDGLYNQLKKMFKGYIAKPKEFAPPMTDFRILERFILHEH